MSSVPASRGADHQKAVLSRLVDSRLADLRAGCGPSGCDHVAVQLAAQLATNLQRVIDDTSEGNAADWARVRGAVRLFCGLGRTPGVTRPRTLPYELRMINDLVRGLGASELTVPAQTPGCSRFEEDPAARRWCPMFQRLAA
ncbi:hypothetical protein [Luedemannella helvata]|uniref:Uncharacterized protein n=1 Tax=Luedemannella helvata TaxID=349315 RepID=A0ABN2JUB9_9ACTN